MIRVFIVDDHEMFRKGIASILISENADIHIIGESETLKDFYAHPNGKQVDILLLDLSIKDSISIHDLRPELIKRPDLKVIALTMHNKPVLIKEAINSGIRGYVVKHSPPEILKQAIEKVAVGGYYLDPEISDSIFSLLISESVHLTPSFPTYNSLTAREQEVFRLLAEGNSPKIIAKELFLSQKTVENYRYTLMQKLELHSEAELVHTARTLGVI